MGTVVIDCYWSREEVFCVFAKTLLEIFHTYLNITAFSKRPIFTMRKVLSNNAISWIILNLSGGTQVDNRISIFMITTGKRIDVCYRTIIVYQRKFTCWSILLRIIINGATRFSDINLNLIRYKSMRLTYVRISQYKRK